MTFGGKVNYPIRAGHHLFNQRGVTDITSNKRIGRMLVDATEIFQITGVGEFIKINNLVGRMVFQPIMNKIGANKTGAAGH